MAAVAADINCVGDYPQPKEIKNTDNFRIAKELSSKFKKVKGEGEKKKVAIIGGGLSGLSAAKSRRAAAGRAQLLANSGRRGT